MDGARTEWEGTPGDVPLRFSKPRFECLKVMSGTGVGDGRDRPYRDDPMHPVRAAPYRRGPRVHQPYLVRMSPMWGAGAGRCTA